MPHQIFMGYNPVRILCTAHDMLLYSYFEKRGTEWECLGSKLLKRDLYELFDVFHVGLERLNTFYGL